jgi:putative ABC transport system ATP-binding protein
MIELKNISVHFGGIPIFHNLSVRIKAGDFVTIIGANGAGKTTLFDLIAGRIVPQSGRIIIDGRDVTPLRELERAPLIARLFQNLRLNTVESMTVAENLALATYKGRRVGLHKAMQSFPFQIVENVLRPLNGNIDDLLDKPMGSLSGGQRQMIALIMATLCPPKILLLDEPTAVLDPQSATKMLIFAAAFIKQHAITTLLITHDQRIALRLGDKLWVVQSGSIKQYDEEEKKKLAPEDLIGEIDYEALATRA